MKLSDCHNVSDLRKLAKRNLPWPVFNYMDGGADDELTLGWNTTAFNDYELLPTQLSDISNIDTSTTVLGQKIDWPVIIAPTGASRLFHHEAEPAVIRAANKLVCRRLARPRSKMSPRFVKFRRCIRYTFSKIAA
jgi:L-lactate dehydrogenase (cytochrome)